MQREHRAERRNDEEGDPPTEQAVKRTSEQRRKARRSRHRNHGQRQSPRELLAVEQVTCDGARQDRGSASPKRLDDSAEDQEGQGVGEGTKDTAGDEDYKPPQHQPFAAEAVGKRSDQKLPDREGNEEAAQRQAEFLGRNAEAGANPRKGRKDDVGGKCAERSQPSEQEQDSPCPKVLRDRTCRPYAKIVQLYQSRTNRSSAAATGVFIPAFSFPGFDSIPGVILAKHRPKFPTALRGLLAKPLLKQDR